MKDFYEHRRRGKSSFSTGEEELKDRLVVAFWLVVAIIAALCAI